MFGLKAYSLLIAFIILYFLYIIKSYFLYFAISMKKRLNQSAIVRKISSNKKTSKIKKALWEFNEIIASIYKLIYIDNLNLRKAVQKALNRGESYHKLKKAVSFAYSGKFRVKTEMEQTLISNVKKQGSKYSKIARQEFNLMMLLEKKESKFMELGKCTYILAKKGAIRIEKDKNINQLINDIKKIENNEAKVKKAPEKKSKKIVKKAVRKPTTKTNKTNKKNKKKK